MGGGKGRSERWRTDKKGGKVEELEAKSRERG
jgi:hypothetical protein